MIYTKKSYTKISNTVNFPSVAKVEEKLAKIEWEPGTHETLRSFPEGPRGNLGYHLYLVQKGEIPPDSSPCQESQTPLNYGMKTEADGIVSFTSRRWMTRYTSSIVSQSSRIRSKSEIFGQFRNDWDGLIYA